MSRVRWLSLALAVWCALAHSAGPAQVDAPSAVPGGIEAAAAAGLASEHDALVAQMSAVQGHIGAHDGQCSRVRSDDSAGISSCRSSQQAVLREIADYRTALAAYEARLRAAPRQAQRVYRPSGSGLVGGTGWQLGYYVPEGASPEVRARALQSLREQSDAANRQWPGAGARYDQQIDLDRYNFAIGIANETNFWIDLGQRVLLEQLTNGQYTARPGYQEAYNSLRDRQFDELGCHSNGAMICLAALMNGDVMANSVVLYGPQVTPQSMALWNRLLAEGRISGLQIIVAQNDPITPLALMSGAIVQGGNQNDFIRRVPILFSVESLASTLRTMSPQAQVNTVSCGGAFINLAEPFQCHDMARYSDYRRRCPNRSSGATVPGTRNPGPNGRPVIEPPSPC